MVVIIFDHKDLLKFKIFCLYNNVVMDVKEFKKKQRSNINEKSRKIQKLFESLVK